MAVLGVFFVWPVLHALYLSFTDYQLGIIEGVTKVMDYFNKEKIVRIVLMLFDVSADVN